MGSAAPQTQRRDGEAGEQTQRAEEHAPAVNAALVGGGKPRHVTRHVRLAGTP